MTLALTLPVHRRLPNGTDGGQIPPDVKLIHINTDPADLNKTYQADVAILDDKTYAHPGTPG